MRVHSAVLDPRPRSRMPFVAVLLAALVVVRAGISPAPAPAPAPAPKARVASVAPVKPGARAAPVATVLADALAAPGAKISEGRVRARLRAEGWEPGDPLPDGMPRVVGAAM